MIYIQTALLAANLAVLLVILRRLPVQSFPQDQATAAPVPPPTTLSEPMAHPVYDPGVWAVEEEAGGGWALKGWVRIGTDAWQRAFDNPRLRLHRGEHIELGVQS